MTKIEIFEYLSARKLGVLGTVTPAGQPQGALVGYAVTDELEIVFDTLRESRKYCNLTANPAASFVVGWEAEDTVQIDGRVEELTGEARDRRLEVYFRAWPDGVERLRWPGITYFVLRPSWMRYSDFSKDPPDIHEISLPAAG